MYINWNCGRMNQAGGGEGGVPQTGALPPGTVAAPVSQPSMAGDEGAQVAPPAAPAAPPAAPPVVAPVPPADITLSSEQFNQRLERDRQSQLTRLGFENEAELVAMQERDRAATEAAETARLAQMTREQTLQEDVNARTVERDHAQAEVDDLRFRGHVAGICATVGVRNLDYATHMIEAAANALPEGQELDVEAYLRERVDPNNAEHSQTRAAFGIESAPIQTTSPITDTGTGALPPTPPPAGGTGPETIDAMDMNTEQWAQRRETLGIG